MEEKNKTLSGLTSAEVEERVKSGKVNAVNTVKTKSIGRIFYDTICTVLDKIIRFYC